MDKGFLKEFNCICPIRTNSYDYRPHCVLNETHLKAYEFYEDLALEEKCHLDCSSMNVFFDRSDDNDKGWQHNSSYARLYFKSKVKVSKSVIDYDAITLMAEVGGYMGLLLGSSIMDITFLINKIFDYIF